MNVPFHDVAQKCGGHTQKEDGKVEGSFGGSLGKADVVGDLLAEDGPTIDRADAAVDEQCGDCAADPFVVAPVARSSFGRFHSSNPFRLPERAASENKKRRTSRRIHAQTVGSTAILPMVNSTESVSRIAVIVVAQEPSKVNLLSQFVLYAAILCAHLCAHFALLTDFTPKSTLFLNTKKPLKS